jgi:hypothetical protein
MADTQVFSAPQNATDSRKVFCGPFFADVNNAVFVCDDSGADLNSFYTSDAFATAPTQTEVEAGNCKAMYAFPDWAVPGDTGTIVHVAWMDVTQSELYYVTIDASDGTIGTKRTVDTTLTVSGTDFLNRICITKTRSGNIIIAGSTQTETFAFKSTDNFVTSNTSIASPYETATEEDHCLMFPANTLDNNDACAVFQDRSAGTLTLKKYDDGTDSWASETTIVASGIVSNNRMNMDAVMRASDGKLIVATHTGFDTTTNDILCYEVDPADTVAVTALTTIETDLEEAGWISMVINQQNDDIYVCYIYGSAMLATTGTYYKLSTNGGTSWGTRTKLSEDADDDIRMMGCTMSITDAGGQFMPGWYNDDTTDIWVNLNTSIEISAATGGDVFVPRVIFF